MTSACQPVPAPESSSPGLGGNWTREDADFLAKLDFKDPKFCSLLEEYARDIQDPKARAEQEAYIAQLESAGELEGMYGKGVQVIQAEPGMVVKTKTADGAARVYINICTCPKVGRMVVEQSSTGGRCGSSLTLPNIMNVKGNREGRAPDGGTFKTSDFIVHPDTLPRCIARLDLYESLIIMAIEKVEEATQVKLMRKYKLPKVPYKGVNGEQRPPVLLLRTAEGGDVVDGRLRPLCDPGSGPPGTQAAAAAGGAAVTSAPCGLASSKDAGQRTSSGRSGFSFGSKAKHPSTSSIPAVSQDTTPTSSDRGAPPGVQAPAYQLVERARVDLGSAWSDTGRALQYSNATEALVVRVQLPGVTSATGIQLSLAADSLELEVPGKYKLQLPLKYKVSEQQATAKFITNTQMMVLTLPVVQPAAPDQRTPGQVLQQSQKQQQQLSHEDTPVDQEQVDAQLQQGQPAAQEEQQQQELNQLIHFPSSSLQEQAALPTQEDSSLGAQAAVQCTPQEPTADSPAAVSSSTSEQQAGVTGSKPTSPVTVQPLQCAPDSNFQSQTVKTENQLRWEALHQQLPTTDAGDSQVQPLPQADSAPAVAEQPALGEDALLQPPAPAARKLAVPLRPRLASRRVSAADFV